MLQLSVTSGPKLRLDIFVVGGVAHSNTFSKPIKTPTILEVDNSTYDVDVSCQVAQKSSSLAQVDKCLNEIRKVCNRFIHPKWQSKKRQRQ